MNQEANLLVSAFKSRLEVALAGSHLDLLATSPKVWEAEGVIAVALHNQGAVLRHCLESIRQQSSLPIPIAALIVDDSSQDDWLPGVQELLAALPSALARAQCGSAARTRNLALDLVDQAFPRAHWVARLDADDRFAAAHSLASARGAFCQPGVKFVLGGNRLRRDGVLLQRTNPADLTLVNRSAVLARLAEMARGNPDSELPSCNLLLARGAGWRYPEKTSAEDHWLVAKLLLTQAHRAAILAEPFYCDYTLDGAVTRANLQQDRHLDARKALFKVAQTWADSTSNIA